MSAPEAYTDDELRFLDEAAIRLAAGMSGVVVEDMRSAYPLALSLLAERRKLRRAPPRERGAVERLVEVVERAVAELRVAPERDGWEAVGRARAELERALAAIDDGRGRP